MRKSMLLLFALFLLIGFGIVRMVANGSATASQESTLQEKPTPILEGVMTEKQKEHSKLYKKYSQGLPSIPDQLASGQPGVLIKVHPPLEGVLRNPIPISSRDFLRDLSCGAGAVVIAKVKDKHSQLTETKDFVFTDYEVAVEEVLKDNLANHIAPKTDITITRPGGEIQINGKTAQAIDASFQPLKVGKRYALFLDFVPTTGSYKAVSSKGSFELSDIRVTKLTEEPLPLDREVGDPISFKTEIRAAVAEGCRDK